METTVKGILQNFLSIIQMYGYVLMGNRLYYEGRVQPPLLTQMMAIYYTYTKDEKFMTDNIAVPITYLYKLDYYLNFNNKIIPIVYLIFISVKLRIFQRKI